VALTTLATPWLHPWQHSYGVRFDLLPATVSSSSLLARLSTNAMNTRQM